MSDAPFSRRQFVRLSAASLLIGSTTLMATSCVAPVAAVFTGSWFTAFSAAVAAATVAPLAADALKAGWEGWTEYRQAAYDEEAQRGFVTFSQTCGQSTVPAIFFSSSVYPTPDPATDRLVFCVPDGSRVTLDPWLWQALSLFSQKVSEGKSGEDLAMAQGVCGFGLIPNGPITVQSTTTGRTTVAEFATRSGSVELTKTKNSEGESEVLVVATGVPPYPNTKRVELSSI